MAVLALAAALAALAAPPPPSDAARSAIAPVRACPGQANLKAPRRAQVRAMHCMTNYARAARGRRKLRRLRRLDRAAARKSADILACGQFSHTACGRPFTHWMERFGYVPRRGCWRAAENIAWGTGPLGTVRAVFRAWMRSPGHRRNILDRSLRDLGAGLRVGRLSGAAGAHVWTQVFGTRAC